jgi:hypothetical protein
LQIFVAPFKYPIDLLDIIKPFIPARFFILFLERDEDATGDKFPLKLRSKRYSRDKGSECTVYLLLLKLRTTAPSTVDDVVPSEFYITINNNASLNLV